MRSAIVLSALAAIAAAAPQVTSAISPMSSAPAGCSPSSDGSFQITVVNVTTKAKRSLIKRQAVELTLNDGILKDAQGRTGYIAANYQFQFDGPPQTGAIYTAGFSLCSNGSLALGGNAVWWQCLSGGFYNLYDRDWAPQCSPIYIEKMGSVAASATTQSVSQSADGQPIATSVSQRTDGQILATTTAVSQRTDGQVIATTSKVPVTQIADGQLQNGSPVSQMTDGQVYNNPSASSGAAVSQMTDGQIIATSVASSGAAVSQMTDGQIIATSAAAAPSSGAAVSQMTDGQIIAATSTVGAAVTQMTDGQVAVPTGNYTGPMATGGAAGTGYQQFTGAAVRENVFSSTGAFALVAALFFALL